MSRQESNYDLLVPYSYKALKRGPQVVLPKDSGLIISYTGINKNSECVDAGTGSGWLAITLARVAGRVTSYDIRDDFLALAERNRQMEHLDNLILKKGDVTKKIAEKNVDLVTLDMPDAQKALKNAHKALKTDGYVVGYLPHIEQVKSFVEGLSKLEFKDILILEATVRDILVREQGTRPSTKGVWHTAYLVFGRK